jgi:putative membrane protein
MILRSRPSGFRLFFIFRGSVLSQIWGVLLVNIVLATVVTLSHGDIYNHKITLTAIPFPIR